MKSAAHIFTLALLGAFGYENAPLHAAQSWSPVKMKPMMAVSLDAGDKHIVGYYMNDGGVCKLTLMIGDATPRPDEESAKPSRLLVMVDSGKSAKFDTVEGKTLDFACEENARSMSADEFAHLALHVQPE